MKRILLLTLFITSINIFGQAPQKMSYQAIIRDASNTLLKDQQIGMQISILKGTITGNAVYVETQTAATNGNGLVGVEIGTGTASTGTFSTIDWSKGPYFIKTETDPAGGTSYSISGTSQLMSVPYALYAETSGSSIAGPKGDTGAQGIQGVQGDKGDTGDTGAQGTQGIQGDKGDTEDTGAQGTSGIVGEIINTGQSFALQANAGFYSIEGASATFISNNTERWSSIVLPRAGTIQNLYVLPGSTSAVGSSVTFTVRINGADTSVQVVAPGGSDAIVSNTANSVDVSAGDIMTFSIIETGGVSTVARFSTVVEFK